MQQQKKISDRLLAKRTGAFFKWAEPKEPVLWKESEFPSLTVKHAVAAATSRVRASPAGVKQQRELHPGAGLISVARVCFNYKHLAHQVLLRGCWLAAIGRLSVSAGVHAGWVLLCFTFVSGTPTACFNFCINPPAYFYFLWLQNVSYVIIPTVLS